MRSRKKQNLFRARIADPRELLQCFLGSRDGPFEDLPQIALKLAQDCSSYELQLVRPIFRPHASQPRHLEELVRRRRKNVGRFKTDLIAQGVESSFPSLIADEVSHILEKNHLQRVGGLWQLWPPVGLLQLIDYFQE